MTPRPDFSSIPAASNFQRSTNSPTREDAIEALAKLQYSVGTFPS